ncbi:MAG TPA: type II toxin-antitoxin system VapB family antitoxin [Chloroflexota bacterium]
MKRTTILADESLLWEAKKLAEREGKTFTDVVREALAEYVAAHRRPRKLSIIGIGHGPGNVAEHDEEILRREIHPIYGWSRPDTWGDEPKPGKQEP